MSIIREDIVELPAVLRTEARMNGDVFPIGRMTFEAAGVVRSLTVDELEALVTAMDAPGGRIDWIAERAGIVAAGEAPFTVLLDSYDLATFMLRNGLHCPSADKNPERYEDGEIVGWAGDDNDPASGTLLCWNLDANLAEDSGETLDDYGFHRIRGREAVQLGLSDEALRVAMTRFSQDGIVLSYGEALEIAGELEEHGLSITRPANGRQGGAGR